LLFSVVSASKMYKRNSDVYVFRLTCEIARGCVVGPRQKYGEKTSFANLGTELIILVGN